MKWLDWLRSRVSALVLRGSILDFWLRRKARELDAQYTQTLLAHSRKSSAIRASSKVKLRSSLKKILFIGDIHWELEQLIPEITKICPVQTLDLHPCLREHQGKNTAAGAVVSVLDRFTKEERSLDPDLIFFYARSALLSEEAFHLLRRRWNVPLLGMNLDDKIEFLDYGLFQVQNDNYQKWAGFFDLNLSNVRAAVDWYADQGHPVYYFPEGYCPKTPPPPATAAFAWELAFVGSWRPERAALCEELRAAGVPLEIFGRGWPHGKPCENPEAVYRSAMMNLGIGFASPSRTLTTLKARDFECPGAGACYLTTYNWELALHYHIGKEILCYRSIEELLELFSFYRRRPEDCLKIAQSAYHRCLNEHTWEKRFRRLFQEIGV